MTKAKFTKADMDAVSDSPELTAEDIAAARPFAEVFPEMAAKMRATRGAQKAPTKVSTTIRLSPEVIAHFKAGGSGWQARIDAALKEWVASH
ncbi:BrnA antitoxin family protein [Novosphingobium sp. KACC 22771]|uniref:BrnA antitoxin family protein n=1 Tax=Novosphingobium sp. KACC 22771 TaxID=3025670 RepID=UPI002365ED6B|nr:BrnA antitoxin family protein [Novosphingobium sp. KACC 22771]WDF71474.1 BrnA antitoxin family protein [Novosphingobium sp. KACC 22771]